MKLYKLNILNVLKSILSRLQCDQLDAERPGRREAAHCAHTRPQSARQPRRAPQRLHSAVGHNHIRAGGHFLCHLTAHRSLLHGRLPPQNNRMQTSGTRELLNGFSLYHLYRRYLELVFK